MFSTSGFIGDICLRPEIGGAYTQSDSPAGSTELVTADYTLNDPPRGSTGLCC